MDIPKQVQLLIDTLKKRHYEAYVVGGAVRDYLLGKQPSDFDVATNALPLEMKAIFADFKVIETGIKHGTLTVITDHMAVEVTTYRIESDYKDYRHPNQVKFVDQLYLDLSRRDFTINACAFDGDYVDYFGGIEDINKKIIRCVGNPKTRFEEDTLRILRALRFACQLGFSIESQTKNAIFSCFPSLSYIAAERIMVEINHMLVSDFTQVWPEYREVFYHIIPELKLCDYQSIALRMKKVDAVLPLRLAMLFLDIAQPTPILKRLKYPNRVQKQISTILTYAKTPIPPNKIAVKSLLRHLEVADVVYIIDLQKALGNTFDYYALLNETLQEPYKLSHLAINGHDLIRLKIKKKQRSRILENILTLVIEEKLCNEKESILRYVKQLINEKDANC